MLRDEDARQELISRFQRASKSEAKKVYTKYRDVSKVEYNDLYSACLLAFASAIKTYDGTPGFYSKWKTIASREMIDEVVRFSVEFSSNLSYSEIVIGEDNDIDHFFAGDDDVATSVSANSLYEQVVEILANPKYRISNEDRVVFMCYIHNFSFTEIGKIFNLKYATVRSKVVRITDKLKTILNNTKD